LERIEALEKYVGETCQRIVKSEKEIEANKKEIEANKKEIGEVITTTKEIEANKQDKPEQQSMHNKPPGLDEPPEDFELLVTSDPDAVASTTGAPS